MALPVNPTCFNIGQAQHRLAHLEEGQGGADAEALAEKKFTRSEHVEN